VDPTGGAVAAKETTAANVFSGDAALKYTNPDNASAGGWHGISTNDPVKGAFCVPLRPGASYTLRLASRVSAIGVGQQYRLRLSFNAAETSTFIQAWTYKAANAYQLDLITFTVPTTAEANAKLYVEFNRNGAAATTDFWIDSLRIDELVDRLFYDNGDVTGAVTIDWARAPTQRIRLIGNATLSFLNGRPGVRYVLDVQQDATGSRTVTWPPPVTWAADTAPTLTTTAAKLDVLAFEVVGDLIPFYRGAVVSLNQTSNDVKAFVGNFVAGATTVITGLGFKPVAVIFWATERNVSVDTVGRENQDQCFGIDTQAAHVGFSATTSDNAAGPGIILDHSTGSSIITRNPTTGVLNGAAHISSMDADGFTLTTDTAWVANRRIFFLALGGATLVAKLGSFNGATVTGAQAVAHGLGSTPTALLLACPSFTNGGFNIGVATDATHRFSVLTYTSTAAARTAKSYGIPTECCGMVVSGAIERRADFTSFDATNFTVNWITAGVARTFDYLVLGGCKAQVVNGLTQTDLVTDIAVTGVPFRPLAGFVLSHNRPSSVAGTLDADASLSMGAFAPLPIGGTPLQLADNCFMLGDGATANSVAATDMNFAAVYANISATGTEEGKMAVTAINPDGFTARMTVADVAQERFGALLVGA